MVAVGERLACARCGAEARSDDQFCVKCGAPIVRPTSSLAASKGPIQWKWVAIGTGVILAVQFCCGLILDLILIVIGAPDSKGVGLSVSLLSFPIGGSLVAFMSPGLTIREPAIGAVTPIALFAFLNGTDSLLSVLFVPVVYLLTLSGAKLGERLQTSRRGSS